MTQISKTAIILDGVELGKDVVVEDYCIIGAKFRGFKGEKTYIGDGAVIRSHTVIYAGNKIGKNFQTGNKANIRELNEIGDNVSVGTLSVVEHHIVIENDVRIHSQVFIPEYSYLRKGCWIGPGVVLTNSKIPLAKDAKSNLKGPTIQENAIIGANSTILPAIQIGSSALVGAGSLVSKDVLTETIVTGNPAKVLRHR
jgi:acetyltransferase-like isoleucine patch superfamily enzyme